MAAYPTTPPPTLTTPPPPTSFTTLSYPAPQILLITLSRPKSLNCIPMSGHYELHSLFAYLDSEPSLRCAIITGSGRAFCAGADLKEWQQQNATGESRRQPPSGFGGLSRRAGKKPVIAAVNGICFGGGFEMVINCDLVLASEAATFALPEVKRGVVAIAGALPRLVRVVGKQRASELALLGETKGAREMEAWGLVNRVTGRGEGEVVREAVKWGEVLVGNSPDSIVVTKKGLQLGWDGVGAEEGSRVLEEGGEWVGLQAGENVKEGLKAFVEKRRPQWRDSKL